MRRVARGECGFQQRKPNCGVGYRPLVSGVSGLDLFQILLARYPLRGTLQACFIGVLTVYG